MIHTNLIENIFLFEFIPTRYEMERLYMQLNITTDYAIRTILCLENRGNRKNAYEISEEMAIPERYLLKVLKKLKQEGIIRSFAGSQGGYELAKDMSDISLADILQITENTVRINRCLEDDEYCSRKAVLTCPVRKFYCGLQTEMMDRARGISLLDILNYDC